MSNFLLGIIAVGAIFCITAVACTLAGVRLHHWLLEHPKLEKVEEKADAPGADFIRDEPYTTPIEIVMVEPGTDTGVIPVAAGAVHLTLAPVVATFEPEPVSEGTIDRATYELAVLSTKLEQLSERLQHKDMLRARYLRILRTERVKEAEACLAMPEIAPVLLSPAVETAMRRLELAEAA